MTAGAGAVGSGGSAASRGSTNTGPCAKSSAVSRSTIVTSDPGMAPLSVGTWGSGRLSASTDGGSTGIEATTLPSDAQRMGVGAMRPVYPYTSMRVMSIGTDVSMLVVGTVTVT